MIAPLRSLTPFVPSTPTPIERAELDREHDLLNLVIGTVLPAGLSARHERELIALGAEAVRRIVHQLDVAVAAAASLDREEAAANEHVLICSWCRRWRLFRRTGSFRCCAGFRRISRSIDRLHQVYRRAVRRVGGGS